MEAEKEAVEVQLMIEWFEQDEFASREFIENAVGMRVYLPDFSQNTVTI